MPDLNISSRPDIGQASDVQVLSSSLYSNPARLGSIRAMLMVLSSLSESLNAYLGSSLRFSSGLFPQKTTVFARNLREKLNLLGATISSG
jgi:hypothetical protein